MTAFLIFSDFRCDFFSASTFNFIIKLTVTDFNVYVMIHLVHVCMYCSNEYFVKFVSVNIV